VRIITHRRGSHVLADCREVAVVTPGQRGGDAAGDVVVELRGVAGVRELWRGADLWIAERLASWVASEIDQRGARPGEISVPDMVDKIRLGKGSASEAEGGGDA